MRHCWLFLVVFTVLVAGCNARAPGLTPAQPSALPSPSRSAAPSRAAAQSTVVTAAPVSPMATPPVGDTTAAPGILNPTVAAGLVVPTVTISAPVASAAATPVIVPVGTALPGARVTDGGGRLNARSGPGTGYAIVAKLDPGQAIPVTGQVNDCAWLQVTIPGGDTAWVSGDPDLVKLLVPCADVARVSVVPTLQAKQLPPTVAVPTPLPTVPIPQLPAGQGCYVFQNLQEVEETIQLMGANGEIDITVTVPPGGEHSVCVTAGRYDYAITPGAAGPGTQDSGSIEVRPRQSYRWFLPGPPQ